MRISTVLTLVALAMPAAAADRPVRVATLLPYVEDALARLDPSQVEVVATVRRSMHETPNPSRIDLGNPHSPNVEKLVEANADIVVADVAMHGPRRDDLARGGEVLLIESDTLGHTFDGLLKVGDRVGAKAEMAKLVAGAREKLAGLTLDDRTPALLLFGTPGSFMVISDRTWIGNLAAGVGFDNVGADSKGSERVPGFVQVSDEAMASLQPEIVILIAHGDPHAIQAALSQRMAEGGAWAGIRAAATRGVHVLPAETFAANPGLNMPQAAQQLHDLVAPQVGSIK